MKKLIIGLFGYFVVWQIAASAIDNDPSRGPCQRDDGAFRLVNPGRDANQSQGAMALSTADLAHRAQSKLINQIESDGIVVAIAAAPANDLCTNADSIVGEGTFSFDNAMATLDGGEHPACSDPLDPQGTMDHDVWYCWTSNCTGPVVIQTCNQTIVDTKLAVYDGCGCPAASANLLGCNDDGCGTGSFLQSRRTFLADMTHHYLLRLGTYPGDNGDPNNPHDDLPPASGGIGTFSITCLHPPCTQPAENCQSIKANAGSLSDRTNSLVADNFEPTSSGTITDICWWGSYGSDNPPAADTFRINYYANSGSNLPGALINPTPFQQPGTLTVTGPVETVLGAGFPIFEYSATHAGIPVTAGQTYWVEISNDLSGVDHWYWQQGFGEDQRSLQDGSKPGQPSDVINGYSVADQVSNDFAFCVGVPIVQPSASPCLTATNSCCLASATERGCNNQTCCEAVCACDPFCCNVAWDINCATVGFDPNCGAQVVCPGLCAGCPDGTIDCNENGTPDDCEVEQGLALDCDLDAILDECETDSDGDAVPDDCDQCPGGDDRQDLDNDGAADDCDGCPNDANKTSPGFCGCGLLDQGDSDGDGTLDCVDLCPGADDTVFAPGCVDAIPAASTWGLVVLALMLLAGAKVVFTRRTTVDYTPGCALR